MDGRGDASTIDSDQQLMCASPCSSTGERKSFISKVVHATNSEYIDIDIYTYDILHINTFSVIVIQTHTYSQMEEEEIKQDAKQISRGA